MKIKCFGIARDIFDGDELNIIDTKLKTVAELKSHLISLNSQIGQINSFCIAVNQEYAEDNQLINESDEIAIIPPVAGG